MKKVITVINGDNFCEYRINGLRMARWGRPLTDGEVEALKKFSPLFVATDALQEFVNIYPANTGNVKWSFEFIGHNEAIEPDPDLETVHLTLDTADFANDELSFKIIREGSDIEDTSTDNL